MVTVLLTARHAARNGLVWVGGVGSIKSEMAQRRRLLPLCVCGGVNVGVGRGMEWDG